jgi:hypothetical protein
MSAKKQMMSTMMIIASLASRAMKSIMIVSDSTTPRHTRSPYYIAYN